MICVLCNKIVGFSHRLQDSQFHEYGDIVECGGWFFDTRKIVNREMHLQ